MAEELMPVEDGTGYSSAVVDPVETQESDDDFLKSIEAKDPAAVPSRVPSDNEDDKTFIDSVDSKPVDENTPLEEQLRQNPYTAPWQLVADKWNVGIAQPIAMDQQAQVLLDLNAPDAEIKARLQSIRSADIEASAKDAETIAAKIGQWHPITVIGEGAQMAPYMWDVFVAGLKGGVVGAGIGAGVGLAGAGGVATAEAATGVGAPVGALTATGAALGGAITGFAWGSKSAQFARATWLTSGDAFNHMVVEQGISPKTARPVAVAVGVAVGALELVELDILGKFGRDMAKRAITSEAGKKTLLFLTKESLKHQGLEIVGNKAVRLIYENGKVVASETVIENLQEVAQWGGEIAAANLDNKEDKAPTWENLKERLVQTTLTTVKGTLVIGAATGATGHVTGRAIDKVSGAIFEDTAAGAGPQDLVDALKEGMRQGKPTQSDVQKTAAMSDAEILDTTLKPQVNAEGSFTLSATETKQVDATPADATTTVYTTGAATSTEDAPVTDLVPQTETPVQTTPLTEDAKTARLARINEDKTRLDKTIATTTKELEKRDVVGSQTKLTEAEQNATAANEAVAGLEKKLENKDLKGTDSSAVAAKLEQAYQVQEQTQKELALAARALRKAQEGSTATKALQNTLDKAQSQRDTLQTEEDLINEGLLTTEDIKNAKGTATVGQIAKARLTAVKAAAVAMRKGLQEGRKEAKTEIAKVQKHLAALIRESDMTPADKSKFLTTITNIQTEAQLTKALPVIEGKVFDAIEKTQKKQALARIATVLKNTALAKKGALRVGKFTADIQHILDVYREMITAEATTANVEGTREAAIREAETARLQGKAVTDEQMLREAIAEHVGNVKERTAEELNDIADDIEGLAKLGKAIALQKRLEKSARKQELIQDALADIQGEHPVATQAENAKERAHRWTKPLKDWFKNFYNTLSDLEKVLAIISQDSVDFRNQKKSGLMKRLSPDASLRNQYAFTQQWQERFMQKAMAAFGIGKPKNILGKVFHTDVKALIDKFKKDTKVEILGTFENQQGAETVLVLSKAAARKLLMEMRRPELRAGHEQGNGYTYKDTHGPTSTETLLEESMDAQDMAFIDAQFEFYNEFYQAINAFWREEHGADLPFVEFYSAAKRRVATAKQDENVTFFDTMTQISMTPSSAKATTNNAIALDPQNDTEAMQTHISDWAHFMAWHQWNSDMNAVFGNPTIKSVVETKFGKQSLQTLRILQQHHTNTASQQSGILHRWMNDLMNKFGTAFVGGKLVQIPRQLTSVLAFMEYVSPAEFVTGVADFMKNPKKAIAVMEKSPILQQRAYTFDRDFKSAVSDGAYHELEQAGSYIGVARQLGMTPVMAGDRLSVWAGGWAVYKSVLAKTGSEEQAMAAFEEAFDSTQQSGNVTRLSAYQLAGTLERFLTIFTTYPIQATSKEVQAVRNFMNKNNAYTLKEMVKIIGIYHITIPVLYQTLVTGLPVTGDDDADKERWANLLRAAFFGEWNNVLIVGGIIQGLSIQATNLVFDIKENYFKPEFGPLGSADDVIKLTKAAGKAAEDPSYENTMKLLKKAAKTSVLLPKSLGGGLPLPAMQTFFQDLYEFSTGEGKDEEGGGDLSNLEF